MASLNKVMIMGRLGQDPEMRYTQNQIAVCTLNVATSEFKAGQDGQRSETTEWHKVVVWRNQAENCGKYLSKGSAVFVEGKLQTRSWEDQNGQKKYTTEIVANSVQFLPSARDNNASRGDQAQNSGYSKNNNNNNNQVFSSPDTGAGFPQADVNATSSFGAPETASMDDIPF